MKKINCARKIMNFKNDQMFEQKSDGTKNYWTVGKLLCDMLLVAKLEPTDDPLEVYKLAKRLYNEKTVEISEEKANELYQFVKKSEFATIMKGQILEELLVKPQNCTDCDKKNTKPKNLK